MNQKTPFLSVSATKFFLLWLFAALAAGTLLTHIAQIVGIAFGVYAAANVALFLIVTGAVLRLAIGELRTAEPDWKPLLFVLGLGLVGAILTLITHRSDGDDLYYIPNAVYYLEHPDALMGFDVHFLYSGGEPFVSTSWATSLAIDYFRGAMAHVAGLNYLTVYYLISAAIFGFAIPLATFYLVSRFTKDTVDAAVGTVFAVSMFLILRDGHRTYGNLAFPRIFQGKALLLSVGLPTFAAMTIDFFYRRSRLIWVSLFAASIALTGATTTTVILLPSLALLLTLSFLVVARPDRKERFSLLTRYFLVLSYVGIYAIFILLTESPDLGVGSVVNEGYPTTFLGHASLFITVNLPLTPIVVISVTILFFFRPPTRERKFLTIWMAGSVVLFLNPLVARPLIEYVTTPNVYWRMFYLYPFPLIAGYIAASTSAQSGKRENLRLSLALLVLAASVACYIFFFTLLPSYAAAPHYKVKPEDLELAREITEVAPAGPMLAPEPVAGMLSLLSSDYPQMRVRETAVQLWMQERGQGELAEMRLNASAFVSGENDQYVVDFRRLLETTVVKTIVLADEVAADPAVQQTLQEHGYTQSRVVTDYVVVWN